MEMSLYHTMYDDVFRKSWKGHSFVHTESVFKHLRPRNPKSCAKRDILNTAQSLDLR